MPKSLDSLGDEPIAKALILAAAKAGKTSTIAYTATQAVGQGYIACCSTLEHLRGAKDLIVGASLPLPDFDMVKSIEGMEAALKTARTGVKDGKYHWVMVDDFGLFCDIALEEFVTSCKGDGRKYWDQYTRHVNNTVLRWLDLRCHVFGTMHYLETAAEMEGQVAKSGPGIVPAVQGGKLRQSIPGQFNQVIWMEKTKSGERIFRLSVDGVTGPGCNNLPSDVKDIPADVGVLLKALAGQPVESTDPTKRKK
jgi:hypothetical protein